MTTTTKPTGRNATATPSTTDALSLVFAAFDALHVSSNDRGDVVITQGSNTITFPACLAGDVAHAIGDAERGDI